MFPYPARRGTMARQTVNEHIIRVRLPRIESLLVGVGCFVAGAYDATCLAFGFNVWQQSRVHNHSLRGLSMPATSRTTRKPARRSNGEPS